MHREMTCTISDDYWTDFYKRSKSGAPVYPSQFAAFAINEFAGVDGVIEFGCGNGRDSHFFATNGFELLALDASEQAIALCRSRNRYEHACYRQCKASAAGREIEGFLQGKRKVAVYARFFLHAIDEGEQCGFLGVLSSLLPSGSQLFLEYRTIDDARQEKEFGNDHYRRYLEHRETLATIEAAGFSIAYEVEGRGLAKYKDEDARVGRCVAIRGRP
ncbi:class I SAM-dependent methyltransferase [Stutzerimonas kirkiae]|uniref:class I SAM-dependent methyltransferase n=1 Tax=Stutzerimonas kirkiae TaxID=2211392 RepID=UPI0013F149FE|nr:methyltransferase domain-containing protein [Stutzerimonas kirkiae]